MEQQRYDVVIVGGGAAGRAGRSLWGGPGARFW